MTDSEGLVYSPTAEQSARALLQADAYLFAQPMEPSQFFPWKSGVKAPVYTDCRRIQSHPAPFRTLVRALASSIEQTFPRRDAIVGMAEAGIVWSSPVSIELGEPHGFVRKTRKKHGTGRMVEGNLSEGSQVVLVDDLMGSGGTASDAISLIEGETGAQVVGVQTIVNWGFAEMRRRFRDVGVPYKALVSYPEILSAAVRAGRISERAARELRTFYQRPRSHQWRLEELTASDEDTTKEAR